MREFQRDNTIILKEDARPIGTVTADHFRSETKGEDEYWGVPIEYFEVENGQVFLDSDLASRLEWTIDGVMPDMLNIAALPSKVKLDGNEFHVNPGFWCSNISKEDVVTTNEHKD